MDKRQQKLLGLSAVLVLTGWAPCSALAQALIDPMRPPEAIAPSGAAPGAPPRGSGLQGAITSPARKLALIDGSVVPMGSAVRQGTLTGLSDSAAVLKKNGERDVLLMYPDIDKRPAKRQEEK